MVDYDDAVIVDLLREALAIDTRPTLGRIRYDGASSRLSGDNENNPSAMFMARLLRAR